MDIKFWIWLIIIVVSLIVRARKKQSDEGRRPSPQPRRPEHESEERTKPLTFEELLTEIQASKTNTPKPAPVEAKPVIAYSDTREHERSLERTDYIPQRQAQYDLYEKAKQEAFFRPSLEETMKLENTIVRFGQFRNYQQERPKTRAAEFAEEIRNPAGFRKAFIMSEILNRRF